MSTEIPSEITPAEAPPPQSVGGESGKESGPQSRKGLGSGLPERINLVLILVIILVPVIAWQWYDTREQITGLQHELAKKLAEADASGKESRSIAGDAAESGRRTETKLGLSRPDWLNRKASSWRWRRCTRSLRVIAMRRRWRSRAVTAHC